MLVGRTKNDNKSMAPAKRDGEEEGWESLSVGVGKMVGKACLWVCWVGMCIFAGRSLSFTEGAFQHRGGCQREV